MNELPRVVNAEGLYNLNALHKVSRKPDTHSPRKWLETQEAKDIISALAKEKANQCVITESAGVVYADELLAIDYAKWVNPLFCLAVNKCTRLGELTSKYCEAKM